MVEDITKYQIQEIFKLTDNEMSFIILDLSYPFSILPTLNGIGG